MKTGNTTYGNGYHCCRVVPQWSPVMKTGNTFQVPYVFKTLFRPQWSPVMKTGNTHLPQLFRGGAKVASMEPGHEDREYADSAVAREELMSPQWSPVMKTGNTARLLRCRWLPVLHTLARTATRHPQPMGGSAGRVDKNQP